MCKSNTPKIYFNSLLELLYGETEKLKLQLLKQSSPKQTLHVLCWLDGCECEANNKVLNPHLDTIFTWRAIIYIYIVETVNVVFWDKLHDRADR